MRHAAYSIVLSACLSDEHRSLISAAMNIHSASDLNLVLSQKREDLVKCHGISNPLHSVFDNFERMSRPALVALGALHGVNIAGCTLKASKQALIAHIRGGNCGLHKSGFRHIGCASLLALADASNVGLHVSAMDLDSAFSINFDLAKINVLVSDKVKQACKQGKMSLPESSN
jgi:hypothetical protein